MVRRYENPSSRTGRSPLAVAVAAGVLAGGIGSYGVLAPSTPNAVHAQASGKAMVVAGSPARLAVLTDYRSPAQFGGFADGGPSLPGRQLPATIGGLPPAGGKSPITFSLFAGWGGAITWDPSTRRAALRRPPRRAALRRPPPAPSRTSTLTAR